MVNRLPRPGLVLKFVYTCFVFSAQSRDYGMPAILSATKWQTDSTQLPTRMAAIFVPDYL